METQTAQAPYLDTLREYELARLHRGHFFDAGSKRFFRSRIGQGYRLIRRDGSPDGRYVYFATSEQFVGSDYQAAPRRATVRVLDTLEGGSVNEPPGYTFQQYASMSGARRAAERLARLHPDELPAPSPLAPEAK